MATFAVGEQAYPTQAEIRSQCLNDQVFAADAQGISINVLPGSDRYITADAFAAVTSLAIANGKLARSALSPLTAQGDDCLQLAAVHGVYARPASKSSGFVIVKTPLQQNGPPLVAVIPAGYKCTATTTGVRYQTTAAATVSVNMTVEIECIAAGATGDLDEGVALTWDSSSVGNLLPTCFVSTGGIDGGADADTVEIVRARLLEKLAAPGIGGNNDHVVSLASNASSAIESAYSYAAIRGPGSVDAAVLSAEDDREVSAAETARANGALVSNLPAHWSINVTTVNGEEVDVVFDTTLPLPQNAGGAGGGWRDADPWPAERTKVTAYDDVNLVATVDSTVKPLIGQHIGIWDPAESLMREYEIVSSSGIANAWVITVQNGFKVTPLGAYVSAGAHSLTLYAATALAEFKKLGPGEKTDNVALLPRSRRHPPPDVRGPMNVNSRIITGIETEHGEIALSYNARYASGGTTPLTTPSIPATTADPPFVIVLNFLAFVKA